MLIIKDPADLLEYLRMRRELTDNGWSGRPVKHDVTTISQLFVWDEAIKAVESMINQTGIPNWERAC